MGRENLRFAQDDDSLRFEREVRIEIMSETDRKITYDDCAMTVLALEFSSARRRRSALGTRRDVFGGGSRADRRRAGRTPLAGLIEKALADAKHRARRNRDDCRQVGAG